MNHAMRCSFALLTFIALILAGCGDSQNCTLLGCTTGVEFTFVDVDDKPISAFNGSVAAGGQEYMFECSADTDSGDLCSQGRLFLRVSGIDEVVLNVHSVSDDDDEDDIAYIGAMEVEFKPEYPNGKECGAACERAQVTVVMTKTQASTD